MERFPRWQFALDLRDADAHPATWSDARRLLRDAECGEITAEGDGGDCAVLEFNATHAAVWYIGRDRVTLRPFFPSRPAQQQSIEQFFCPCCGVRLGSLDEMLARCMTRGEGVRLIGKLLRAGSLPECVPEERPEQPVLPGLDEQVAELAEWRVVEWRPFLPSPNF